MEKIRKRNQQKYFPKVGEIFGNVELIEIIPPEGNNRYTKYKYRCKCGIEKFAAISRLYSGRIKSCGCLNKERATHLGKNNKLKIGNSTENAIISTYKYHANKRGHIFKLTKEQCHFLFKSNCNYCNIPPSITSINHGCVGEFTYNGIDRVDNSKGYTLDNSVACCKDCNFAKRKMTKIEFLKLIKRIYEFSIINNSSLLLV